MQTYEIVDEDNVPQELVDAVKAGKTVECEGAPGLWIEVEPEFRCGVTYRIKGEL